MEKFEVLVEVFGEAVQSLTIIECDNDGFYSRSEFKAEEAKVKQARAELLAYVEAMWPRYVWMLTTDTNDEDGFSIIGVFSTEEKARDFMQASPGIVYDTPFMMELDPSKEEV
jgi:hypothetical protein